MTDLVAGNPLPAQLKEFGCANAGKRFDGQADDQRRFVFHSHGEKSSELGRGPNLRVARRLTISLQLRNGFSMHQLRSAASLNRI